MSSPISIDPTYADIASCWLCSDLECSRSIVGALSTLEAVSDAGSCSWEGIPGSGETLWVALGIASIDNSIVVGAASLKPDSVFALRATSDVPVELTVVSESEAVSEI